MDHIHIQEILLADDTTLISYSPRCLKCVRNQVNYAFTWRLHYNRSKNAFLVFHKQQNSSVSYSITLFCSEISQTDNTVYAGCVVKANT